MTFNLNIGAIQAIEKLCASGIPYIYHVFWPKGDFGGCRLQIAFSSSKPIGGTQVNG